MQAKNSIDILNRYIILKYTNLVHNVDDLLHSIAMFGSSSPYHLSQARLFTTPPKSRNQSLKRKNVLPHFSSWNDKFYIVWASVLLYSVIMQHVFKKMYTTHYKAFHTTEKAIWWSLGNLFVLLFFSFFFFIPSESHIECCMFKQQFLAQKLFIKCFSYVLWFQTLLNTNNVIVSCKPFDWTQNLLKSNTCLTPLLTKFLLDDVNFYIV